MPRVATNIFRERAEQRRKLFLIIDKLWGKRPVESHVGGILSVCQLRLRNMSRNSLCNLGKDAELFSIYSPPFPKFSFSWIHMKEKIS